MAFWPLFGFEQLTPKRITYGIIDSICNQKKIEGNLILKSLYGLKTTAEINRISDDSVYAKILQKIGVLENRINKDYNKSLALTFQALRINTSGKKNASLHSAIIDFYNLGYYYKEFNILDKSLIYYDSAISFAQKLKDTGLIIDTKLGKVAAFYQNRDYQKCLEESISGMEYTALVKDTVNYLEFLNQKAQALIYQNQDKAAEIDLNKIIQIAKKNFLKQLATAFITKATIIAKSKNYILASDYFKMAIATSSIAQDFTLIPYYYNNFGDFYLKSNNCNNAVACYLKAVQFGNKINDFLAISWSYVGLGKSYFYQKKYNDAIHFYLEVFKILKIESENNILFQPSQSKLINITDKQLMQELMCDKTKLLLALFKSTGNNKYLEACEKSALITDTLINKIRQLQIGSQSKLLGRNNTRDFYADALEACYLAKDAKNVFYFMEKSRAVLLNEHLNELGATYHLPIKESELLDSFRVDILQQEQQLSNLKEGTKAFEAQQRKLADARIILDNHVRLLEQKFPLYYQYKYDDHVPDLATLQKYLDTNNQAFIHYFITDSLIYILGITPSNTKLKTVPKASFDITQLSKFLAMCENKEFLFTRKPEYIALSNFIYTTLFKPLEIHQKRVVVCAENFLIPFGALYMDNKGEHFLLQDYAFSYAYSARSLLKPFNNPRPKGDLLGIAPVNFATYLDKPELRKSGIALEAASKPFNNIKLLLNSDARKYSFIKLLPDYSVVNVFSHASFDTSEGEPLLFMVDSAIHLSELQKIKSPATQLVVLSACQTNAGKLATGEGIYSLARGFASAGIPSVAATLWKADEDAIYEITKIFDQNLAKGMRKDDALQQAELAYMQQGDEKAFPYYWANMVLVGSAAPVKLSSPSHWGLIVAITGVVLLIVTILIIKQRNKSANIKLLSKEIGI